jgi:hypothetical protein
MRAAGNFILVSAGTFVALIAVSMATYPGGTWTEPQTRGHDFLRNFLCDLLGPAGLNGEANPVGAIATRIAMIALVLGLWVAWWAIPTLFSTRASLAMAIRILGTVSTAGLLALPLTPPSEAYELHAVFALSGGGPGLAAGVLSIVGLGSARHTRRLAVLSAVALMCALLGVTLYAHQLVVGGAPTLLLPVSHRIATALLLGWMAALALQMRTERLESARATGEIAGGRDDTGGSAWDRFRRKLG